MQGVECPLPPVNCLYHNGRRPWYRKASFWGDSYWEDEDGNPLLVNTPVEMTR